MLKVSFENKDGLLVLLLDGHAGQSDIGHDIVCSACSILAYTVAQVVRTAKLQGDLKNAPTIILDSGKAIISCEPNDEEIDAVMSAYLFAQVGFSLLAYNFPQYVELKPFSAE